MRIFTVLIIIFVLSMVFFEVTGIEPKLPSTQKIVEKQTVVVETIDAETGEVVDTYTENESISVNNVES